MLVKISRNPSRSLVYGYSSWAETGDLYGLQRGDLHGLQRGSYHEVNIIIEISKMNSTVKECWGSRLRDQCSIIDRPSNSLSSQNWEEKEKGRNGGGNNIAKNRL